MLWKQQSFIQLHLTKTFPRQIPSDLQQITRELRLEQKFQENLSAGNGGWAHTWESRLLLWKVILLCSNRGGNDLSSQRFLGWGWCWISRHQGSEGHLKELTPYSSVPWNWHFISSSWAKLQTAGGFLEHFKTFLSRYIIASFRINTHATHSPFCRSSECVSQAPSISCAAKSLCSSGGTQF